MGTPAYIAPEVLSRKAYDGKAADVWSCGVTLYVMVVGGYPFEDPADARNFRKTIMRIRGVQYAFPAALNLSEECKDLVKRIFVLDPVHRLNIAGIKQHPWFQRNLPAELQNAVVNDGPDPNQMQNLDELMATVDEAKHRPGDAQVGARGGMMGGSADFYPDEDMDADLDAGMSGDYGAYD